MKKVSLLFAGLTLAFALLVAPAVSDAACICTKQYAPVCAIRGNSAKTYGNSCMAGCVRAKICAKGKCKPCPVYRLMKPKPGCKYVWYWRGCCRAPKLICKRGCVCPKIYKPVCGIKNGRKVTYSNSCVARCARAKVCAAGKCKSCRRYSLPRPRPGCKYVYYNVGCCKRPKLVCKSGCVCPRIYKPVCTRKGRALKTYSNSCTAKCAKARVCAAGKCKACPVFRLANPGPGCKYKWYYKGCCKYPKKVCKKRRPYCTKIRCRTCNKSCLKRKRACYAAAKRLNSRSVAAIRARCKRIRVRPGSLWHCLCQWASRKASSAIILRGMRACYAKQCRKYKCCKTGRKLCIPHPPNVRCVKAPCCRKLVCDPRRCR